MPTRVTFSLCSMAPEVVLAKPETNTTYDATKVCDARCGNVGSVRSHSFAVVRDSFH